MLVKDVMTDYVIATSMETTLRSTMNAMEKHKVRHLPVLDGGRVIGVVSNRELDSTASVAAHFDADRQAYEDYLETPIRDFLKTRFSAEHDVITVRPDAELDEAIELLVDRRLSALPVVDSAENLVGILSYIDILSAVRGRTDAAE